MEYSAQQGNTEVITTNGFFKGR